MNQHMDLPFGVASERLGDTNEGGGLSRKTYFTSGKNILCCTPTKEYQAAISGIFEAGMTFVGRVAAQVKGRADVLLKNR